MAVPWPMTARRASTRDRAVRDEEYRLSENPDGHTAVSYRIAAEPRGIFRIARRPLAARARTLIDGDLARFVRVAESRP